MKEVGHNLEVVRIKLKALGVVVFRAGNKIIIYLNDLTSKEKEIEIVEKIKAEHDNLYQVN
jgi:hypothetical protein